ncbi:MSMEG_0565 family glycosyltransferase [Acidisoma cladoniae]|jgi:glycosyltransferase-like protein|uniref:MSMEG_0565 family glycosyltransferase n=1 Tax=Acidisoma cladoniae TaxID=3040935 RepID=UPI00254FA9EA|nr:MSMEG_0565 family glycosyltransferase [Acidisoma sp. PAMC 29798]
MNRRIAVLTHSTNPRGGVVHAMQLAEALCDMGEDVTLLAPALPGQTFFRIPRCDYRLIPAVPVSGTAAMVAQRIEEIADFLCNARYDIFHAQDPISANALDRLARPFLRTVHHLDDFADPRLAAWQDRGMRAAERLFCVSRIWGDRIAAITGRVTVLVGNGVDTPRFTPAPEAGDARLALPRGPLFLAMGGIEARKNSLSILRAFLSLQDQHPTARLLIAGGATLLDHGATRAAFDALCAGNAAVHRLGVIADEDMPALYRRVDAVVSPSVAEGFGLVAIEAMACGRPVIVSDIAPFNEHFRPHECLWADPTDVASIATAMAESLRPKIADRLQSSGPRTAARFTWRDVAAAHLPAYADVETLTHA